MSRQEATPIARPYRFFGPWPLWLRLGLLIGLVAAELLFLSVQFDTKVLSAGQNFLTRLAGDAPIALRVVLASLAAFGVIVFPRAKRLGGELRTAVEHHRWGVWLLLHLVAFAGFYALTRQVFAMAARAEDPSGALLAQWLGLGLVLAAMWLLALAPWRYWRGLMWQEKLSLLAALAAGLAAWGIGEVSHQLWQPLAAGTFWLSKSVLGLFYDDVLYDRVDHVLGTPGFMVTIAPQCSGYEGIGLVTVFLAIYLWLFRSQIRFPQAFILFPLGAITIWLANTIRISTLIAIGTSFSSEVALGGFHSQAGWIAFSCIALGLVYATRQLQLFSVAAPDGDAAASDDVEPPLASALLVPLLVLMASVMLTSAVAHGFDWLYPLRPVLTAAALWRYRAVYRSWDWSWNWQAVAIGVVVFAVWLAMEPADADGSTLKNSLEALPAWQEQGWLAFRVIGSVLLVPIAEELAFRGYLLRRLQSADFEEVRADRFTWLSFLGSSLIFGLVHGRWLAGALAGMAYAGAVYRRGKLGDAIVAHMVTNGMIALWVLLGDRWSLWT
jgi:exosortase E/protease (VPEID-CTERM system)